MTLGLLKSRFGFKDSDMSEAGSTKRDSAGVAED